MAKPASKPELESGAEEAFFEASASDKPSPAPAPYPLHRVVLTGAALLALVWLCAPILDEVRYHFSGQKITDLGDAAALPPDTPLPTDWYVRVHGILGNKAATVSGVFRPGSYRRGPVQVRQLLGSPIFVEFDQKALGDRYTAFTRVTVEGRLASLGPKSELSVVRDYFKARFGMELPRHARVLIVGERPGQMWRYPILVGVCALVGLTSLAFLARRLLVGRRRQSP